MKRLILLLLAVLCFFTAQYADVYVRYVEQTEPYTVMGKKRSGELEIKEQWFGNNKVAMKSKNFSLILDMEKNTLYAMVPSLKSCYKLPAGLAREQLMGMLPEKARGILASVKVTDVKAEPFIGKKKIGGWNCQGCRFQMTIQIPALGMMPKMSFTMWTTKDIRADYKLYDNGMDAFLEELVMKALHIDEKGRKELEKLDAVEGYQVATDVEIVLFGSSIKAHSQMLEVVDKKAPADAYTVPEGYKVHTISPMQAEANEHK